MKTERPLNACFLFSLLAFVAGVALELRAQPADFTPYTVTFASPVNVSAITGSAVPAVGATIKSHEGGYVFSLNPSDGRTLGVPAVSPTSASASAVITDYLAHPAVTTAPVGHWTPLDFMQRFTQGERLAIITAARADAVIEDFRSLLAASSEVRSDNADLLAGLDYLVAHSLLTTERRTAILTP